MTLSTDLSSLAESKILVVGDVMLDRYIDGHTGRISPEAPVPVVHVKKSYERPGGAANVALNITSLGAKVTLLGLIGEDENARRLKQALVTENIDARLLSCAKTQTITKLRVISRSQQLIRLDNEDGFAHADHRLLFERAIDACKEADVVVFSDYGKGTLQSIIEPLLSHCKAQGIPALVDPKGSDFSIYRNATVVTPNFSEFVAVVGQPENEEDLENKARQLLAAHDLDSLLVTRSEKGMSLFQRKSDPLHLAAKVREVYDVTGAGDTVIASLAVAIAARYHLKDATTLANLAAGIVVGKAGTATPTLPELKKAVVDSLYPDRFDLGGVLSLDELVKQTQLARTRGETLVMTNGCFDILHAGHVQYLDKARKLGDRLIIAVNSDASVTRLKGASRPINSLENRMVVLSALACVDWVVPFEDDTPISVIKAILPDKLVKGGDYKVEAIIGYREVTEAGGEVSTIELTPDCSTTRIIEKART
ncbi:MAG: D-beta-D-heptose 7-phosphate kinase/D-beta-D-heptose 1-phosphate adenosyltransferase [Cellvibrionaceae bacterium]|jgi:D-beta-D-heptose 7-phosphate kinase/D-beta-D-heptose 1-phosphate adenosyltransferase